MQIYAVTRSDLSFNEQTVHVAHAVADLCWAFLGSSQHIPQGFQDWAAHYKGVHLLTVHNVDALFSVYCQMQSQGHLHVEAYFEPNLGHEITAFVTEPSPEMPYLLESL